MNKDFHPAELWGKQQVKVRLMNKDSHPAELWGNNNK
jgi:hypothetical protein